ncbi:MAG: ABC transporter ATP-binding protein [Firmicutes bacterium]|nr:ABC transporter ATP-binding protein [Bacillota bacterium]
MNECVLEIKHLKKYYGNIRGVEDVSLKINKGEIYGFIGPNGAGKSTTIRTIIGLINKTDGKIYINGKEHNKDDIETKKIIGYLPSEINLYDDMSVKELFDYHESFYKFDTSKRRKELVKLLKIQENKKIEDLSLGNLKKVGIVLALIHNPKILILDEPTSGLDPLMQSIFHKLLLEEKKKGTTILYSSHVLSEVSNLCDKIGFIKDGKIIKEDLIENIKKNNYTYLTIRSNDIKKIKKELNLEIKEEKEEKVKFINNMDCNTLINKLSKYNIDSLLIEEITLEDLFEKYYR